MISAGIQGPDDIARLQAEGFDLTRLSAWLGVGTGNPELDATLSALGVETSYGDFRGEREGTVDYQQLTANGAEVISVDDVVAASEALNAGQTARQLLETCPAATQTQR